MSEDEVNFKDLGTENLPGRSEKDQEEWALRNVIKRDGPSEVPEEITLKADVSTKTYVCEKEEMFNGRRIVFGSLFSPQKNLIGEVSGYTPGDSDAKARFIGHLNSGNIVPITKGNVVFYLGEEDGKWWDLHCHGNLEGIEKVKFEL